MQLLDERCIDSRRFFHPLSSLPAYEGTPGVEQAKRRNKATYRITPYGPNLPSALCLTYEDVTQVCQGLRQMLTARTRTNRKKKACLVDGSE